jgi:hypothetical protein
MPDRGAVSIRHMPEGDGSRRRLDPRGPGICPIKARARLTICREVTDRGAGSIREVPPYAGSRRELDLAYAGRRKTRAGLVLDVLSNQNETVGDDPGGRG